MPTAAPDPTFHQHPIFLLRHGETTWNRAGRLQGQLDAPLTPRGIAQALAAGRQLEALLREHAPVRLLTSPLGRTRRSANLVLQTLAPRVGEVRVDDRLKEISWGELEGLTRREIRVRAPAYWRCWKRDRWSAVAPGGESYALLRERLRPLLEELLAVEQPVVVVAHGGVRRVLRGLYGGLSPAEVLALEEPHDVMVRLVAGAVTVVPIDEEEIS